MSHESVGSSPLSLMILSYDDISGIGGSYSTIREEVEYFGSKYPTCIFARAPKGQTIPSVRFFTFPIPRLPTNHLRLLISLLVLFVKLVKYAARVRPSVFHAQDVYVGSVGAIVAKLFKVRLVLNVHGPIGYEFGNFNLKRRNDFRLKELLLLALVSGVERFAYRAADAVIVISDFERRFVEQVRSRDVFTIKNGINLKVFHPVRDKDRLRNQIGLPPKKAIVTYVGRLVPKNGILVIAKSVPLVLKARDDVVFQFVGDGFGERDCKRIVSDGGCSGSVIFVGRKSNPAPYYQASDLFVSHVSTLVDGVGLTTLEAVACGVPVIVGSDNLSYERLGNLAYFVPKDDPASLAAKILRVLQMGNSDEISAQLRKFAERSLSWDTTFSEYEKVLFQKGES